jgi:Ca2+-binding EF-hand superfamily protein
MLFALGAASSIWDALQSLGTSKSSSTQSTTSSQTTTNPFDITGSSTSAGSSTPASGTSGWSQISPQTMSALIDAQSQSTSTTTASTSPSSALQDLFSQIDANGDGQISKSEFETALGAGGTNVAQADDVFSKLDKNGDGSVSLDEMKSALQGHHGGHHHAHDTTSTSDSSSTDGTTSTSSSSTDPLMQALDASLDSAAKNNASTATQPYDVVQQMIQRGLQTTQPASVSSISVTA